MKTFFGSAILTAALIAIGCSNSADPPKQPSSPAKVEKAAENGSNAPSTTSSMKGIGKASPEAAFDAIIATAQKPDEKEYLGLVANNPELADSHEEMIKQFSGTGGREEGVKQVMSLVLAGMAVDEPHKRFPADIDGDKAHIIVLRADKFDKKKSQYLKYEFVKSGGLWYYTAKSFGPAEELDQAKYNWTRPE